MESPVIYRARYLLPISSAPLEDGSLLVKDGRISAVGPYQQLSAAHPDAQVVDFKDSIILPPFVNAHTHLELTSVSEWSAAIDEPEPQGSFVDWILWLIKVKRTLSERQLRDSLQKGLQASLRAGTGVVGDICTTLSIASVYEPSPLRGRVFAEVLGQDLESIQRRLDEVGSVTTKPPSSSLSWGISPHAPYTLSQQALDIVFAYARAKNLQSCIHLAESSDESRFLQDATGDIAERLYQAAQWPVDHENAPGCSPVRALCRENRLQSGDLAVHGVEVDDADVSLLKRTRASVVLCPRSNAALKGGKAPVTRYLSAGVNLALGTDSLASSPSLSIWDELAFANDWFAGAASPRKWLEIATLGGAKALGLEGQVGALASGLDASFQVVSMPKDPGLAGLEEALFTAGDAIEVSHLYLSAQNTLS